MSETKLVKKAANYSVATVGNLNEFAGKAFIKDVMNTTSMEVSFGTLEPGQAVPFFHKHKQNEEVYIVLSGEGVFVLDGEEIAVSSGSIVRVAPGVSRCNRNTGKENLCYICIQAKDNSLEGYVMTDAIVEQ